MQTVILYNEHEVRQGGNKEDIRSGYNLWIDITDPSPTEILSIQKNFDLDIKTLETYIHKSKKPQVRVLDSYTFTLILDLKYKSFGTLVTDAVYLFCGRGWLITIHSSDVDLMVNTHILFEQKNKTITEATIDALYYSIITEIISRYELLLTSIELTITELEQKSLHTKASKKMLDSLDTLTKQIIILRRQFWHFTVILLPLTLIAGVCGMNGADLANLGSISTGFITILTLMIAAAAFLFWYFRKKQWIMAEEQKELS